MFDKLLQIRVGILEVFFVLCIIFIIGATVYRLGGGHSSEFAIAEKLIVEQWIDYSATGSKCATIIR